MGIRMLNHRPAVSRAAVGAAPAASPSPVPALAADASTARIPADLPAVLRRAASGLSRRLTPGEQRPWRLWADLARGYVALALARLPRPAPTHTVTVFVAAPARPAKGPGGRPGHEPRTDRRERPASAGRPPQDNRAPHREHGTRHDRHSRQDEQNRPRRRDR
ncbi:hypothetical protein [Streptomyces mexicanus]|uniref:hypothetical protein n=1 Tax=Streptomyces mexicanus TaxID=178566 RepID=UPI0036C55559